IDAILRESRMLANQINQEFGRLAGEVAQKIKELDETAGVAEEVMAAGAQTLRNFRSVWEEFSAPGMGFNRKTVALLVRKDYKDIEERLSLTPVMGRVKQMGQQLEGLGLRLPTVAISDRLLSAKESFGEDGKSLLNKFDLSSIVSDIGGLRLDRMFPGLKVPNVARDSIKITQGFDKEKLIAWVKADLHMKLPSKADLLNYGPLVVSLDDAQITGHTHLEASLESQIKKSNYGELSGSWNI